VRAVAAFLAALALVHPGRAQDIHQQAPFFTTPPEVVERMLVLAGTGQGDYVVELGSGDGRVVIHAAVAHGARGLGVDLDAALVARARENAARAGVADRVHFRVEDVLRTDLSQATVVTAYLVPYLLERLEPRLLAGLRPGARIVTHAFALGNWPYDAAQTVPLAAPHAGLGSESRLYLYVVPVDARGAWRAPGGWSLRVSQNYQKIEVQAWRGDRRLAIETARLAGERIELAGPEFSFKGRVAGGRMTGALAGGGALAFARLP
jgi:predicted O-methyltransferase YrrM